MITALLVSLFAGLATSIGGVLATHKKMVERSVLAVSLALAAGAMLFLSFVELLPHGMDELQNSSYAEIADVMVFGTFFIGIGIVMLIDRLLPKSLNPSEIEGRENTLSSGEKNANRHLMRSGIFMAAVLALHNFPEGASTFAASYHDIHGGVVLAIAIALHNIPEGIAVAAPIYAATRSRKKALLWATVSGLTEPLGALVMALLVVTVLPAALIGLVYGLVAGMMTFIALDELLPASWRYQTKSHHTVYGLLAGMLLVAGSVALIH